MIDITKFFVEFGTCHIDETAGKCSPDKSFREAVYGREIVKEVRDTLIKMGYNAGIDYEPLKGKPEWISKSQDTQQKRELNYRVNVVNSLCKKWGTDNVIYVSIHVDAAPGKGWSTAGGWTAYTTRGTTKSDKLAECLYDAAERHLAGYASYMRVKQKSGGYDMKQRPFRIDKTDGDRDKEANYFVLKNTACPAVLTENLFQNNKCDVDFLLSEAGRRAIVNLHVEGIINYIKSL